MMNVILAEGLADREFIAARTEGFDEFEKLIKQYTPERVEGITGIPAGQLRDAARLISAAKTTSFVYSMGITQHTTGTDNVMSIANIAMLTGNIGRPGTGVNPLRGQNNVQGACDMGALPNLLPGYQRLDDAAAVKKFEDAWSVKMPADKGLTVVEMMRAAHEGSIKAMVIMGENPMLSDPDLHHVEESLRKLDFLLVQDIFLTETAQLAHLVLPGVTFAEKDGTFTNTERRVQRVRRAVDPVGDSLPDWQILCRLSTALGYPMKYSNPAAVMHEIASLAPIFGGVDYERLESDGLHWPCRTPEDPGTPILHRETFTRGKGKFHPIEFKPPAEQPDAEYPFILTTGRVLYHFHTGSMTRRSEPLNVHMPTGYIEINPEDAAALGVADGGECRVSSRRGEISINARVSTIVPRGTVFLPFHFQEAAANLLTNPALDPVALIPEFKVCAVRIASA
jgi:predicted molibdopterin-dependent oxidoreductase YjgC